MNDFRLALRLCLRHPVLSLAAIFSLALGIGANTAIFTVLNGSVLRPLAYVDPDQLMVVWETRADNPRRAVAPANFIDWRRETTAFEGLAAFDDFSATLTGQGEAQRVRAVSASANFFEVLGVQAQIGRVMSAADDRPGATPVAVLTDGLWHRLFGGAGNAIGQTLILNSIVFTIVGVLPPDFDMPMVGNSEVWMTGDRGIPRSFPFTGDLTAVRDSHIIAVIGRLAPGASREQAQAQLTSVMTELSSRYPSTNAGLGANVRPLHEEIVGDIRPLVLLLQIAVAVLLLIACANVAHLLLGQAAGRQAEMSLRVALGAGRTRLVRQLLVETLLIAIPGGLAGLAIAYGGVRALVAVAPANLPRLAEVSIDGTVLAFTIGITLRDVARVRSRTGDADRAHAGQRAGADRAAPRRQSRGPARTPGDRGRRAGARAGAAGRRGAAAGQLRAGDADRSRLRDRRPRCGRAEPRARVRRAARGRPHRSGQEDPVHQRRDRSPSRRPGACAPLPRRSPRRSPARPTAAFASRAIRCRLRTRNRTPTSRS